MTILTTPSQLAQWLTAEPGARIIAIVGPPGSGKTTLAGELSAHLSVSHRVVPMDGFHYPQDTLRSLGRRDRMGAPDTFDTGTLARLLSEVRQRIAPVAFPDFDRIVEEPVPDAITVLPEHELVIVEGNYLLLDDPNWAPIGELLDLSIYVDLPRELRLTRLTDRHVVFGKTPREAHEWVSRVDEPNARLIEATKTTASALYQPRG
jgi:pantothenate kinase